MGAIKNELLDIAQAFGEAAHDLATTPEESPKIVESVTDALQRLRRLFGPSTPAAGDEMTVGTLIATLQQFDPAASVWIPDWNEEYEAPTRVGGVRLTEPDDWDLAPQDYSPKPDSFASGVILMCRSLADDRR